jgi:ATP-dependent helicase Lhr and Lhr-like helicase
MALPSKLNPLIFGLFSMSSIADPRLIPILSWFERQGWQPLPFQVEAWQHYLSGHNGLIQVPTGSGKTYAAVMGAIAQFLAAPTKPGLRLLYITPLRALSRDIEQMGWPLRVESRTGDTKASQKARQLKAMPEILITTPESLMLMLSYAGAAERFQSLQAIVLDEWHELLSTKRGTQTELALARLRSLCPGLQTWALSATLSNLKTAAQAAVGLACTPVVVHTAMERKTVIRSILPDSVDSFPWAGHLGLHLFQELVEALDITQSTLIFTNTRFQAERWYQAISFALPEASDRIALHHSSIDVHQREAIEAGLKSGAIRWVVCTSSLDLGVDFQPVERVVQIGSAKQVARLLQRAGRSQHVPQGTSELFFLPTHALELLEIVALRQGLAAGMVEARPPLHQPYDVLMQHLVSLACGDGFRAAAIAREIRSTVAYQHLSDSTLEEILAFLETGGQCLNAYPRYQKLVQTQGLYTTANAQITRMHRMTIGTITSNQQVELRYLNQSKIGTVEEGFVSKLKPGDVFFFAGRQLEFFQLKDMVATVRASKKKSTITPSWTGGNLAISDILSQELRGAIALATHPTRSTELTKLEPILATQQRISHLPQTHQLLIECCKTREGQHLYVFPLEGRFVHEGLGFLWGYRFAQQQHATFTISVNDYGFEILAPKNYPFQTLFSPCFFDHQTLEADLQASLNLSELSKRQFRGIAQVAGLVFKGYPAAKKSTSQLQVSASLLFDVFTKYEPNHLLLQQAKAEVLTEQLESHRLAQTLERLQRLELVWKNTKRPSPFAFPLFVERLSARLSNESLLERIERMKQQWESR